MKIFKYSVYGATEIGIDLENVRSVHPDAGFNSCIDGENKEHLKTLEQTKLVIAAAPEMLNALEMALKGLKYFEIENFFAIQEIERVLKKAKGE